MNGTVKWFNVRKGYGFVEGEDGQRVAHIAAGIDLAANDRHRREPAANPVCLPDQSRASGRPFFQQAAIGRLAIPIRASPAGPVGLCNRRDSRWARLDAWRAWLEVRLGARVLAARGRSHPIGFSLDVQLVELAELGDRHRDDLPVPFLYANCFVGKVDHDRLDLILSG